MSSIKGKKILILGGNALTIDIVNAAHALGLYTIVTDWNSTDKSPAKLVADEYWMDSLSDIENLKRKIEAHHVSDIITGFSDSYLPYYARLCKATGLPCYATEEVFEQTLDKAQFKQLCKANNVPIVPEYDANSFNPDKLSPNNKVIIKPVDNSGSRGIVICDNQKKWQEQLAYSKSFSASGHVLIEQYMECDDISLEYKIQDGEIVLSSICDRYIYKTAHFGSVTKELIYPSKYIDRYLQEVNDKVIAMFKAMHLQNGVLFMQAFADNQGFYFYEMGYRLSGGRHFIFTENQNHSNAAKEICHFAVTGSMADYSLLERNNPHFEDLCCQISILCKGETTIHSVSGIEELRSMPQIIDFTEYYQPNETIGKDGTTAQIYARVHIVVHNKKELTTIKQHIFRTLSVQDRSGNQLIIKTV